MRVELCPEDIERLRHNEAIRPHRVKFQLTNACNARCFACNLYKIKPQILHAGIITDTLRSAEDMGCQEVDFTGGEPTLHPDFLQLFEVASRLGLEVKVNTNGYLVDEELAKRMVSLGLREYAISIDSHNPDIHNKVRRLKDSWQRAISSIQYVDKHRRLLGKQTKITLYSILNRHNYQDAPKVLDLKAVANYDEINFIPLKNEENKAGFLSNGQLRDFYGHIRPVLLERYQQLGFSGIFRTVNDPFEVMSSGYSSNTEGGFYTEGIYRRVSCYVPSFYTYIVSDGSVVPCCVAPHHLQPIYIMGNLYEEDFQTVWNSERFNSFRKTLARPAYDICKCCSGHHTAFNIELQKRLDEQKKS